MITDLNDAEFPKKQSRAVVQAVVDTAASLGLATHTDLAILDGKIDALKGDIDALKADLAALKATVDKTHLWIRWGFGILFAFMFFLSSRVG